jgi:acetoin utilization protein AcuB
MVIIMLVGAALMLITDDLRLLGSAGRAPAAASAPAESILPIVPPSHFVAWTAVISAVGVIVYSRHCQERARRELEELHCGPGPVDDEPCNPNFQKRQEIQRVLLRHFDEAIQSRIEVRHVMSKTVRAVPPSAKVSGLRELMEREGIRHLLVMKQGVLLGVISDRDIKGRRGWLARHVMTASPLTVTPTTNLNHAITMLLHRRISCLPVVDRGNVRGVLTATDMLMTLQCLMKLLEKSAADNEPCPTTVPGPLANQIVATPAPAAF